MAVHGIRSRALAALMVIGFAWSAADLRAAEGPAAQELLPADTLVFIHVPDTEELVARFQQTALGRIGADPAIRPLVGDLFDSAAEGFRNVEDRIGVTLAELLQMPHGEVCLALLPVSGRRPALVAMVQVGEPNPTADRLLRRADDLMAQQGAVRETETVGDVELVIHTAPERSRQIIWFQRAGKVVLSTDVAAARALLARWDGEPPEDTPALQANKQFQTIMQRCRLGEERRPQLSFYADPVELAKAAAGDNFSARAVLAMIPALGLDGVQGVGGSVTLAQDEYDLVTHLHLGLASPRRGALEILAMTSGDTTPEPFIPRDASTYTTLHWDVEKTYVALGELFDTFRGDGALADEVDRRFSTPLGIDFKDDLLAELGGRFTRATWVEPPARVNSQSNLLAATLHDAKRFQGVLRRVVAKHSDRFETLEHGGVTYYRMDLPLPRRRGGRGPEDEAEEPAEAGDMSRPGVRRPQLCLAVLGEHFVLTDSEAFFKQAVAARSDPARRLAGELDFKLIASKIGREAGGRKPGMITFDRPEENIRLLYDLAVSEDVRKGLERRAENGGLARALDSALSDNPLPPFAALARYLAPGGGMMTSDATGLHYMGFTLRSAARD